MLSELAKVEGDFFNKTGKYVVDLNSELPSGFAFAPARGLDVSLSGVSSEYVTAFASSEFCSVAYKWASNDYGTGVQKSFPVAMLGTKIMKSRGKAKARVMTLKKRESAIKAMVLVKGGCFEMGSNGSVSNANEKPVHRVCLDDFRMEKYEVTQTQFKSVMGANHSYHKNCPNCPVERVSFRDALEYCKALGTRLPTEAEWEYAAREMGKDVEYGTGRSEIDKNSATYHARGTTPVGRYAANSLGLYDMSGNVWEWTDDWRDDNYYGESPLKNPQGPDKGMYRIIRGGSWRNLAFGVRTTKRGWSRPNNRFSIRKARVMTLKKRESAIKAMVLVKGGCFEMGSNGSVSNANEKPVHRVCLDDFRMEKYEVTQTQFKSVMGANHSYHKNCPNCPVERVSFRDALEYCKAHTQPSCRRAKSVIAHRRMTCFQSLPKLRATFSTRPESMLWILTANFRQGLLSRLQEGWM